METLASSLIVYPFGKINLWDQSDGSRKVRAYIVVERPFEGAKTGVAIDGSASMQSAYGYKADLWGMFFPSRKGTNIVSKEAQRVCVYLAKHLDVDSHTTAIYWATGNNREGIDVIGNLDGTQAQSHDFKGPQKFGHTTNLTPALKYFTDLNKTAPWGMYIFITDGAIDDLKSVKAYTTGLAHAIEAGTRKPFKLILIGVGPYIQEEQMTELDDLDTGTSVDLWDHKIATEMSQLSEIFTEVVDETMILAPRGIVRDAKGNVAKEYRDTGLPALLEFTLPSNAIDAFTLEYGGQIIRQQLK
jgi:hypothetical protein